MTELLTSRRKYLLRQYTIILIALVAIAIWLQGLVSITPLTWKHVVGATLALVVIGVIKWL